MKSAEGSAFSLPLKGGGTGWGSTAQRLESSLRRDTDPLPASPFQGEVKKDAVTPASAVLNCRQRDPAGIDRKAWCYVHPFNSRVTRDSITRMPASLSLRQGTTAKFSPPCCLKTAAFSTAISSNVSRQSAEKPGVITSRFLHPRSASVWTVSMVAGVNHSARPNRD